MLDNLEIECFNLRSFGSKDLSSIYGGVADVKEKTFNQHEQKVDFCGW